MALLKRLFGRGEPAPKLPVHPKDRDLVSEADERWWSTLTLKDCQAMERQDNIFRMVTFTHHMKKGLSEEDAARIVRKSHVMYYASFEERDDEPLGFAGEDAKLPYALKDRINRAVTGKNRKLDPSAVEAASSINALIRTLIRNGEI